jgi:GNAT superfamily N-acetyltransferase
LDLAVEWLVSQDRVGQWGTEPFSEKPKKVEQLKEFTTTGFGVWLAIKISDDKAVLEEHKTSATLYKSPDGAVRGIIVGAMAAGDKIPYAPPVDEPETYVRLLVTDRKWKNYGIGSRLLEHAKKLAREVARVSLLRLDCYGGDDGKLIRYYESQGFERCATKDVEGWPCQVLAMRLGEVKGE